MHTYYVSNFGGLVLDCIDADFLHSKCQILILLHFFEIYKIHTPSHRSEVIDKIHQKFITSNFNCF